MNVVYIYIYIYIYRYIYMYIYIYIYMCVVDIICTCVYNKMCRMRKDTEYQVVEDVTDALAALAAADKQEEDALAALAEQQRQAEAATQKQRYMFR